MPLLQVKPPPPLDAFVRDVWDWRADAPLPFLPPPADGFPALSPEGNTPIGVPAVERPVVPPTARDADPRHPWLTVAAAAGLLLVIAVMLVLLVGAGRFLVGTVRLAS